MAFSGFPIGGSGLVPIGQSGFTGPSTPFGQVGFGNNFASEFQFPGIPFPTAQTGLGSAQGLNNSVFPSSFTGASAGPQMGQMLMQILQGLEQLMQGYGGIAGGGGGGNYANTGNVGNVGSAGAYSGGGGGYSSGPVYNQPQQQPGAIAGTVTVPNPAPAAAPASGGYG